MAETKQPWKTKRRTNDGTLTKHSSATTSRCCEGEKPIKLLAQELGVSHWNLRDWKKRYGPRAPLRSGEVLEAELQALKFESIALFSVSLMFGRRNPKQKMEHRDGMRGL